MQMRLRRELRHLQERSHRQLETQRSPVEPGAAEVFRVFLCVPTSF